MTFDKELSAVKFDRRLILSENPWLSDLTELEETPSTQILAKEANSSGHLFVTTRQTATYGRFGRPYYATPAGGLYMSVSLKPDFTDLTQYTLLAAAAVVRAIEILTDKKPTIKWVNDIYLADKKIVGILTEAQAGPEGVTRVVLGMGINFAISDFPSNLTERATSLFFDENPTISPSELICAIWREFDSLKTKDYMAIYKAHSFILGRRVRFEQSGKSFEGLASDLTAKGELIVTLDDGSSRTLNSGEISLSDWEGK
ncbi:MAG: biotin--[acetyl-CoA-carboxylase] ligase [Streptococcaceae bacterium]|jgi:BirA family biotin operon repressor/biotin-[acetyl-CoA-carboxylase] ligase|nr:biotin--[acetyl-CoA-carboxylase] ligase [Streptococcaceae bacterium]